MLRSSVISGVLLIYIRYPPDKRMNYDKLGIKHPFSQPWQELILQWKRLCTQLFDKEIDDKLVSISFHVLRDANFLKCLSSYLKNSLCDESKSDDTKEILLQRMALLKNSLIPIRVLCIGRGCPEDNAVLCLPTLGDVCDLEASRKDKYSTYLGPLELLHKGLKKEFPFIFKQHGLLQHDVRFIGVNTRWLLGYIQNGKYCLADGRGGGIGFISTCALYYMLVTSSNRNLLLFRNRNTLQYRFCEMQVLV